MEKNDSETTKCLLSLDNSNTGNKMLTLLTTEYISNFQPDLHYQIKQII